MSSVLLVALAAALVAITGAGLRASLVSPSRWSGVVGPAPTARLPWSRTRSRRAGPDETSMAEWCEGVARGLRAGSSLARSMADAGLAVPAAAPAMSGALAALDRGHRLGQALDELDDDPSTAGGLVVSVLGACADLGGPAASPLERTAATLHARAAERAERRTASAQARLSAQVLTVLPVGTMTLLAVAEPTTRAALTTPAGSICLAAGIVCNVTGWWWMRRIIGRLA